MQTVDLDDDSPSLAQQLESERMKSSLLQSELDSASKRAVEAETRFRNASLSSPSPMQTFKKDDDSLVIRSMDLEVRAFPIPRARTIRPVRRAPRRRRGAL